MNLVGADAISIVHLPAIPITAAAFAPFGQLISATADGKAYDQDDAALVLDSGTPRFYIMRLEQNGRQFQRITRHQRCTQCLGSLGGKTWLLAVAPPSQGVLLPEQIRAFVIGGDCLIKLHVGTWHAGPYFSDSEWIDFYNLELTDTNINDHDTVDLQAEYAMSFVMDRQFEVKTNKFN